MLRPGSFIAFGSWQADLDRFFVICRRAIKFTRSLESFTATVVKAAACRGFSSIAWV